MNFTKLCCIVNSQPSGQFRSVTIKIKSLPVSGQRRQTPTVYTRCEWSIRTRIRAPSWNTHLPARARMGLNPFGFLFKSTTRGVSRFGGEKPSTWPWWCCAVCKEGPGQPLSLAPCHGHCLHIQGQSPLSANIQMLAKSPGDEYKFSVQTEQTTKGCFWKWRKIVSSLYPTKITKMMYTLLDR